MEKITTFNDGLDKDQSNLLRSDNSYFNARNIRITTDSGISQLAVTNTKGNTELVTIPNTSNVYKIVAAAGIDGSSSTITININDTIVNQPILKTLENIVNLINSSVGYESYRAFLSQDESYFLLSSIDGTAITTFSITFGSGSVTITTEVPAQASLIPIGYVSIRDEDIIITTNETSPNPLSTGGVGQIWKLVYDPITNTADFTLLYNNYLNLTTYHPIAPTAIQGRYENANTKRIYFTDFFNPYRNFNIGNSNGFAIVPELLNNSPILTGSSPILQRIEEGGELLTGLYQAAYRLKNDTSVTVFSELSNLVTIAAKDVQESDATTGNNSALYIGASNSTLISKTVSWTIPDIDTDYTRIEIVIVRYQELGGTPDLVLSHDEPVPSNGIFNFSYRGTEIIEEFLPEDYTTQLFSFTHCKTLAVKDNRLIAGNIRDEQIDFEYDARAYRFETSTTDLELDDEQGNTSTFDISLTANFSNVPETHDAINPNHNTHSFQRNSTTIGGTGLNISYTFGTYSLKADSYIELAATQNSPYFRTNTNSTVTDINLGVTGRDYSTNGINDGLKYAYRSGLLKGYQHNEIYRFAIEFYDKQFRPLFARWIGDIKMPDYDDTNPFPDSIATALSISDFRPIMRGGLATGNANECWVQQLYVKFQITIPDSIKPYIGGYRIARCERTDNDKTILGVGLISPTIIESDGSTDRIYIPEQHGSNPNPTADLNVTTTGTTAGTFRTLNLMFDAPEFLLSNTFSGVVSGDTLHVAARLSIENAVADTIPFNEFGSGEPYRFGKLEDTDTLYDSKDTPQTFNIEEAGMVAPVGSFTFTGSSAGWVFNNFAATDAPNGEAAGVGTTTMIIGLDTGTPLDYPTTFGCTEGSLFKLFGYYQRVNNNQYGGDSYNQRTRNSYIPAGELVNTTDNELIDVFGGDIFIDLFSTQKLVKNFGTSVTGLDDFTGSPAKNSFTLIFPAQSTHNMNLRHGININKDLGVNEGSSGFGSGASFQETFTYNTVYSNENNLRQYIVKPVDFTATEEFDTRIWVSDQKLDGEVKDSWMIFRPANYYDADNSNGPINCLILFRDRVYFFQDSGFGIVPIAERALLSQGGASLTETQIGTATDIIQRPEYISRTIGSKHQWSIVTSNSALYFFDINTKNFYKQNSESLELIKGLMGFFKSNLIGHVITTDNPVHEDLLINNKGVSIALKAGIHCGVDYLNNDVYLTIFDNTTLNDEIVRPNTEDISYLLFDGDANFANYKQVRYTVSYSEERKRLVAFHSFHPHLYIVSKDKMITCNPTERGQMFIHNKGDYTKFYGEVRESSISIIVNDKSRLSKLFTNLKWESQSIDLTGDNPVNILDDTWNRLRVYNDYQNTNFVTLAPSTNIKRKERQWKTTIPRNILKTTGINFDIFDTSNFDSSRLFKEPIRDHYAIVELFYDNENNYRLICPFITTEYLVSPR